MAAARIEIVDQRIVVTPFGAELLEPFITLADSHADRAESAESGAVAAAGRLFDSIASLGDRTAAVLPPPVSIQAGASAITNGIRFTNGGGGGSLFAYTAKVQDVDRVLIPVGSTVRVRSLFSVTSGSSTDLGLASTSWATRVDRSGVATNEGTLDTTTSVYRTATLLVRETTVVWDATITGLGHLVQFSSVGSFSGNRDVTFVGLTFIIDSLPAGSAVTTSNLIRSIERERQRLGYAVQYTVGPSGAYSTLANADAALGDATEMTRQRLALLPNSLDTTKIEMPDFTDLIGGGATSRINYAGSTSVTNATRTDYDPLRLRGTNKIAGISLRTRDSNYPFHSESAGASKDWVQLVEDCILRHDGNEAAYVAGGSTEHSLRWIPAVGVGMSSGSVLTIRRTSMTSLKGGGAYFHNAAAQDRACQVVLEDCIVGGDDTVAADITITTLGSSTADSVTLKNLTLTNGVIAYGVSSVPTSAAVNYADHTEMKIYGEGISPHIFVITDQGRALRLSKLAAGSGTVAVSGTAADALMSSTPNVVIGEAGRRATATGILDVVGHTMGARLGDCSSVSKALTLTVDGSPTTHTFNANMTAVSNATILASLNSTFSAVATAALISVGEKYRPFIRDQEARPINTGSFSILQNTVVVMTGGVGTCRSAVAADFTAGVPTAGLKFGVALEDILIGKSGRVQTSGWINWEQMVGDGTKPNLNEGFTVGINADGVYGALVYAGSNGILKSIRSEVSDGQGRYTPVILFVG
jgi:hypothetical protein